MLYKVEMKFKVPPMFSINVEAINEIEGRGIAIKEAIYSGLGYPTKIKIKKRDTK